MAIELHWLICYHVFKTIHFLEEHMKNSNKPKHCFIFLFASVLLLSIICSFILTGCKKNETPIPEKEELTYVDYPDVDKFFEENSEIKSIVSVEESKDVFSEKEVLKELQKRGFTNVQVTTEYDMAGNYFEAKEISADSDEKHPSYSANYQTKNGDIWTISIMGKQITASPLTFIYQSETQQSVIIAEDDTIVSYDSHGNRFFTTVPHEDYLKVKTVETIDAQTFGKLTVEEIKAL